MLHFCDCVGVGGSLATLADRGESHPFHLRDLFLAPSAALPLEESKVSGLSGCRVEICPRSEPDAGLGAQGYHSGPRGRFLAVGPPACMNRVTQCPSDTPAPRQASFDQCCGPGHFEADTRFWLRKSLRNACCVLCTVSCSSAGQWAYPARASCPLEL